MQISSRSVTVSDDDMGAWWWDSEAPCITRDSAVDDTDEMFDLIVIGSGIIGASVAHHTAAQQPGARVLVLTADHQRDCNTLRSFGILTPMLHASPRAWSRLVGANRARAGHRSLHDVSKELVAHGLAREGKCQIDLGRSESPLDPHRLLRQYDDLGIPAQLSQELAPGAVGPAIDLHDHAFCDPRALLAHLHGEAKALGVCFVSSVVDQVEPTNGGFVVHAATGAHRATRVVKAVGARTLAATAVPGAQRHASAGALLLPTSAASDADWHGLLADAGAGGLHARVRADNSVILGFSAPVEDQDDHAARQRAVARTVSEAQRRHPDHVVDQTWAGWVYKGDAAVAAIRSGPGGSLDLWACQGRGLLVGLALGRHAAHLVSDTPSPFDACFADIAPTLPAEEYPNEA